MPEHLADLSGATRDLMDFAADYTDDWFDVGEGSARVSFRALYKCDRKWGDEVCHTFIASSCWKRRFAEPLSPNQRWYCTVCGARYKTTSGVLLQFIQNGKEMFSRASFPPQCLRQVKFASVQRTFKAMTPDELLDIIPEAQMAESAVVTRHPTLIGTYTYNAEALNQLPEFNWSRLLSDDFLHVESSGAAQ